MRQSKPDGAGVALCGFANRFGGYPAARLPSPPAGIAWLVAALVALAPSSLPAQTGPEIGSSTWLSWEAYGQDACLARAARTMAAARSAFGLPDQRTAGVSQGVTHA